METKSAHYPRKKALLIAIPLGIATTIMLRLLLMWLLGESLPDVWANLSLILGLAITLKTYHHLVTGKHAQKSS